MGTIEKVVSINASPDKVTAALTDATQLEKWFPTEAKTDAKVGGQYYLKFVRPGEDDHEVNGQFTEIGPQRISTSWPMEGLGDTTVDWFFREGGSGTELKLIHNDIGEGGPWDEVRAMMDPGWAMFVSNLKSYLEGGSDLRQG